MALLCVDWLLPKVEGQLQVQRVEVALSGSRRCCTNLSTLADFYCFLTSFVKRWSILLCIELACGNIAGRSCKSGGAACILLLLDAASSESGSFGGPRTRLSKANHKRSCSPVLCCFRKLAKIFKLVESWEITGLHQNWLLSWHFFVQFSRSLANIFHTWSVHRSHRVWEGLDMLACCSFRWFMVSFTQSPKASMHFSRSSIRKMFIFTLNPILVRRHWF